MTPRPSTKTKTKAKPRPGEAEFLATYDITRYAQPSVTVDLAIFTIRDGAFSVLLVERADHPYKGYWALPGGFLEEGEPADEAAWRELAEETGVAKFSGHLEQLRTYSSRNRDPRGWVISVAHVAFAPDLPDPQAGSDAANARWWPVNDLNLDTSDGSSNPDAPALGFDHALILTDAIERVRSKIEYTTLATEFVTAPFTLPELRRVYEAVWGTAPDLANFRRKVIKTAGFVVPTEKKRPETVNGRPPLLYSKGTATTLQPAMLRPGTDPTHDTDI